MLEKTIEHKVCEYAKSHQILVYKFSSPAKVAVPDRLFIFPKGTIIFVEFKRKGAKATLAQAREINRMRNSYAHVFIVDEVQYGKKLIEEYLWIDKEKGVVE